MKSLLATLLVIIATPAFADCYSYQSAASCAEDMRRDMRVEMQRLQSDMQAQQYIDRERLRDEMQEEIRRQRDDYHREHMFDRPATQYPGGY